MNAMPAPLDPAVAEVLRRSPVGPLGGQPVEQVLAGLGVSLPQFPPLPPLPGLPPTPALDPVALLAPITDMLGQFGSGRLDLLGGVNPQTVLSQIVSGLSQVVSLGSSAIGLLSGLAGQATQAAATKSTQAQSDAVEISAQATQINTIVSEAAAAVLTGNAQLAAIAAKLATTTAMLAAVPGGQPAIAAAAATAAAESAAVVAQVRCVLEACKCQMEAAGQPVAVTSAPNTTAAGGGQQGLQQIMQVVQPVAGLVQRGVREAERIAGGQHPPRAAGDTSSPLAPYSAGTAVAGGLAAAGGNATSPGSRTVAVPRPFQHNVLRASMPIQADMAAGTGTTSAAVQESRTSQAMNSASMMPLAGPMAMGARAGDPGEEQEHRPVVAARGEEVNDTALDSATPVIGATDELSEPPDRALTL
ncbi:hypothetical protein IU448_20770 [Nocardia flavorosea]|uniref:hypothetical protein n=1 Tax=Nocardia flavorosea TaxID=53429 RepID=UPI0018960775|nr:hypothetical protein [Nocardia flavorosea]MBF6351425.1 hypothetical protein [Nocardia flavorosea]